MTMMMWRRKSRFAGDIIDDDCMMGHTNPVQPAPDCPEE